MLSILPLPGASSPHLLENERGHPARAPAGGFASVPDSFGQACKERRAVRPGTHKGQYISLKVLPRAAQRREDPAGQQNRETDPQAQRIPVEAPDAS
jgi:hypothetical protein